MYSESARERQHLFTFACRHMYDNLSYAMLHICKAKAIIVIIWFTEAAEANALEHSHLQRDKETRPRQLGNQRSLLRQRIRFSEWLRSIYI